MLAEWDPGWRRATSPRMTFYRVVTFGSMLMFYVKNIDKKENPKMESNSNI